MSEKKENYTYAILMETSGEEQESWYYFIRYQGNEEALAHLDKQLNTVEWYVLDDLSTFDLELKYLVCEQTAKDMIRVDLNATSFHRKFDGKLEKIDLKLKDSYNNEKKIEKVNKILVNGGIENYVDKEEVDPNWPTEEVHSEDSGSSSDAESENSSSDSKSNHSERKSEKPTFEIPRFAKIKKRHNK